MRRRSWRLPALLLVVAIVATGCQMPAAWLALLGGPESRPTASPAAPAQTPSAPLVFERATIDDPDLVLVTAGQVGDHPARHLSRSARLDA